MKKIVVLMAACLAIGVSANAATLSVVSDQATYSVSDTITLTVTGDAQGAAETAAFARVLFGGTGAVTFVSATQNQQTSFSGGLPWTTQPLSGDGTGANAISQLAGLNPLVPDNLFVSTIILTAAAEGVVNVTFDTNAGPTMLNFFGLANGTGGAFTIVPEPTTAGLLGLGLVGLALGGRRR